MGSRPYWTALAGLLVALFQQQNAPRPLVHSSADYVQVDAVVRDAAGRFVGTLGKDDFELLEDGKPVAVEAVELVNLGRAGSAPAVATATANAAPAGGRVYFLVLDDLHTSPNLALRTRQTASAFVQRNLKDGDRAAVIVTSGRRDASTDLTADRSSLARAIGRFAGAQVDPRDYGDGDAAATALQNARRHQAQAALETIERVTVAARDVNATRKAMILISEGAAFDIAAASTPREIRSLVDGVIAAANRATVSIYSIDIKGPSWGGENATELSKGDTLTPLQDEARLQLEGLAHLAENTGGRMFMRASPDPQMFDAIEQATSTYYLLSYRSPAPPDGRFHRISVSVKRRGYVVDARKGYVRGVAAAVAPPAAVPRLPSGGLLMLPNYSRAIDVPDAPEAPPLDPVAPPPSAARSLPDVMARAAAYVQRYGESMLYILGRERYAQWSEHTGRYEPAVRNLESDYAIVRVGDDWQGFRDVQVVDGKPVGGPADRLARLFQDKSPDAIRQGRLIADEGARYNLGPIQRNFNTPTMALLFLQSAYQPRFRFKRGGQDTIDGRAVWKVEYQEVRKPTIIRTSSGKDMPVKGTFWIDPRDGSVVKSHMMIEIDAEVSLSNSQIVIGVPLRLQSPESHMHSSASITVTYADNAALHLLLPAEMLETYDAPITTAAAPGAGFARVNCRAVYSGFRRFGATSKVTVPK